MGGEEREGRRGEGRREEEGEEEGETYENSRSYFSGTIHAISMAADPLLALITSL